MTYLLKSDATGWSIWLNNQYCGHVRRWAKAIQITGGKFNLWR